MQSVSSPLSCFFSASSAATYVFTVPTCTTTIITLEPCALNAEFQHFILRFNKFSLLCRLKDGIEGEREDDFTHNFFCVQKNISNLRGCNTIVLTAFSIAC